MVATAWETSRRCNEDLVQTMTIVSKLSQSLKTLLHAHARTHVNRCLPNNTHLGQMICMIHSHRHDLDLSGQIDP